MQRTRIPNLTGIPLAVLAACALSCAGSGKAPPAPTQLHVPQLSVSAGPEWTGMQAGDPVVAEVGGIPVPAGRYRRALQAAGPDADPKAVLDALVARELLAQEAVRTSGETGIVQPSEAVYQRALVSRLLRHRFVEQFGPSEVPEADLEMVFRIPQVRGKFNHLRMFVIQDYQWICCAGDAQTCGTREADLCFQEGSAAMAALAEEIHRDPPDGEDLPLVVERYQQQAPRLSYQEYEFAYDDDARVQKGGTLIDDSVVEGTLRTAPGHYSAKAIRSKFGWHILYVKQMLPPENRDLADPEVRRDVAEFFLPRFQQKQLVEYLVTLIPVAGFRMLEGVFKDHPPAATPRYPVSLFPSVLARAIDSVQRSREEEPL